MQMLAIAVACCYMPTAFISMRSRRVPSPSMSLEFEGMKAGALKALLEQRSVSIDGCFDKPSLIERAEQYRERCRERSSRQVFAMKTMRASQ